MTATEAGATVTPNGIDFVNKDDARRLLFPLLEKITDSGSSDADKHFHEIGTANTEERHPGFARNRTGQQGLARSRGTHQQTPFGNSAAKLGEFFRIF